MMGKKELRINAKELNRLGVTCKGCRCEVIFDALSPRAPSGGACPNCGVSMPHMGELISAYRNFFHGCLEIQKQDGPPVSLLIRLED